MTRTLDRVEIHVRIAAELASLSDRRLADALSTATPLGVGIGGAVAMLELFGRPVFVKHVPLTDLERLPDNLYSTANLFRLPSFCQYGVSSPGFGAWRELASHTMTTGWTVSGECTSFPLLHHWRVMPRAASGALTPRQQHDVDRQFSAWDQSEAVRERFAARELASASIVLLLEWFPLNLRQWLTDQLAAGDDSAQAAVRMVERELLAVTSFMNARGLHHFDAHFENILTDGQCLYFSDFGQALSSSFTLTPTETGFLDRHRDFDRSYVVTMLTRSVRDSPAGAAIVQRHSPIAALMTDFFQKLRTRTKTTPYPAAALARAWARLGG